MTLRGRRKRVLVHKFQTRLLRVNLFYLGAIMFLFLVTLFGPMVATLYGDSSSDARLEAATSFIHLHKRVWPAVAVATVMIAIHSVFVSHRIAGPLYRFRNVFREISQGNLTARAGVRRRDYLAQDADAINEMIRGLESRIAGVESALTAARIAYGECCSGSSAARGAAPEDSLARLGTLLESANRQLDEFRLTVSSDPQPGHSEPKALAAEPLQSA